MKNNIKKIAYISGTRADFGLMTPILQAIEKSKKLDLQIYATGIHLMPEFGTTINHIKKEFSDIKIIPAIFESDDRQGMAKFMAEFLKKLIEVFSKNHPDFVLTLGDRVEMLCTAMACLYLGIPTGQIHGGDKTTTVDELARHAITKLSHIHFPATQESAERIKKMGEEDWRIHVVGAPALDFILNEKLPSKEKIFNKIGLDKNKKFILVSQHPVSEEIEKAGEQMKSTLTSVKKFGLHTVVVYPHADAGGKQIIKIIQKEKNNPLFRIFPSLLYKDFLALEKYASVWVGNSSGGLIESSSFGTPVVNIGNRQSGRQRGKNVIDVSHDIKEIGNAIYKSLNDKQYLKSLKKIKNPWGNGKTGPRVAKILENTKINARLLTKQITY